VSAMQREAVQVETMKVRSKIIIPKAVILQVHGLVFGVPIP
jgi:hypothetical protein